MTNDDIKQLIERLEDAEPTELYRAPMLELLAEAASTLSLLLDVKEASQAVIDDPSVDDINEAGDCVLIALHWMEGLENAIKRVEDA